MIALTACGSSSSNATDTTDSTSTTTTIYVAPTEPPTTLPPAPQTFSSLSDRDWKLLEKNPDGHIGEGVLVTGEIFQFDSNTGTEAFLAHAYRSTGVRAADPYGVRASMALIRGSESALADFLQDDKFICECVVMGSFSYDTKAGGSNNAISLSIVSIKRG